MCPGMGSLRFVRYRLPGSSGTWVDRVGDPGGTVLWPGWVMGGGVVGGGVGGVRDGTGGRTAVGLFVPSMSGREGDVGDPPVFPWPMVRPPDPSGMDSVVRRVRGM